MASAGPADGGDGDEDDVAVEEQHDGSAQPDGPDRNGVDSGGGVSRVGGQQGTRQNGGPSLPRGWKSCGNGVDVHVPPGTSGASSRLSEAILRRTITDAQHMTQLIQRQRADPNVEPGL
ncbi:unnamed protein product [Vitrella brassicaformis CCMP3155]|uniref:Uncharacterized protein n=1 Tax=Vitrella brassicaformis (strain CCMP3155) TaxID=1169540 RepID=A0A0G4GZA2_VITBC|nr:unnamed protein product [Vitrella brassicaformis CCMP3155]|eukprot:CEM36496.1 unnamed protein product [Vitrella brassicaformis CCMP3155]